MVGHRRLLHVARMAARIEELKGLGLTQAANEKQVTLLALRKVLAEDREYLRQVVFVSPRKPGGQKHSRPVAMRSRPVFFRL